ncbi:hypothetical protein L1987_73027 [Smallanthus sonchifolius]|uniref:Uncharacterized protein n=1 Tax=Smallanthus sonchifolius TaxID=185202 RepID=A0ACB9AWU3_9ASTR|nr:hypothetical protein L1987_73027 [Smallanthus sonchifolius]
MTTELADRISRALLMNGGRTWSPVLEQTLHGIGCRHSLNSTLVSRVIDPFLIHHHSLALGFFDWASQQPGFTHTSLSYQSILKSLSISRQFTALDRLIKQINTLQIQLHASVYHSVIASYVAAQKPLHAFNLYTDLRSDIGPHTTSSLLASLSSAGNMRHAHHMFDHMITRGVPLSTLGFGVFLWRFCATAELDKTLSLLDHVRKQGVNGSIVALLVVHGLCLASRAQEAMSMLDVLRKRDCKPDFMAYRVVAEALRATGNVVHVEQVLKMKRKLGVAPRSSDYRDFIFQLISERLTCEAKDLGEVIVTGNFPIQDDVLNALIGSVSTDYPCSAFMFFNFLIEKQRFPTLLTFTNLGRNLCKHGKHDELLQVSKILSAKEYFVDVERYNVMVSFFCKAGKVREAYQVLQEMKKKGLDPDISSYNYVMEACCKEDMIRPAKRLWDEMFANGCEPNLTTYNILITKFSEIGQVIEAHRLFCHMLERGVQPDATTYDFLIKGFCQENQLETAIQVFKKSFEQDSEIAKIILEKFILYLCKEGEFIGASNLVHDNKSTVGESKSNMMFADAGKISVAIEHMREAGVHDLRAELFSCLSSSSKPHLILEMIQVIENHVVPKG